MVLVLEVNKGFGTSSSDSKRSAVAESIMVASYTFLCSTCSSNNKRQCQGRGGATAYQTRRGKRVKWSSKRMLLMMFCQSEWAVKGIPYSNKLTIIPTTTTDDDWHLQNKGPYYILVTLPYLQLTRDLREYVRERWHQVSERVSQKCEARFGEPIEKELLVLP